MNTELETLKTELSHPTTVGELGRLNTELETLKTELSHPTTVGELGRLNMQKALQEKQINDLMGELNILNNQLTAVFSRSA